MLEIKPFRIKIKYKIILSFIAGILWALSHVGYNFGYFAWISLIPFLLLISNETFKRGILYSMVFGFTVYLLHFWWIPYPIMFKIFPDLISLKYLILKFIIGAAATVLISLYHGLSYSLIFIILKYISKNKNYMILIFFPLVSTFIDYYYPKLWFDQIGYSQHSFIYIKQITDIAGVPLITFLITGCNASIIFLIKSLKTGKSILFSSIYFSITMILIISGIFYGIYKKNYINDLSSKSIHSKIGIVQGNIKGADKNNRSKSKDITKKYNELSNKLLKDPPDLIVWPETAISVVYEQNVKNYDLIKHFNEVPLATGVKELNRVNNKTCIYNSVVLISGNKKKIASYSKNKLLPFIERMPLKLLNYLFRLTGYIPFSPGEDNKIIKINKLKIAFNICYEIIIPSFIRKSLCKNDMEPNIIINVTNDSWFGKTIVPDMHLRIAEFRAIENRKTLIRANNSGYSAIIAPDGVILYKSGLFSETSYSGIVPLLEIHTVYNRFGYFFINILGIFILFILFYPLLHNKFFLKN